MFCASVAKAACKGSIWSPGEGPGKEGEEGQGYSEADRKVGSASFSGIAPGTAKKVSVKLSRKGRTLFRKGKLKVSGPAQGERRVGGSADDGAVDHAARGPKKLGGSSLACRVLRASGPGPSRGAPRQRSQQ